ncbi:MULTISPECIES: patatin-like phospholipase family protein [Pandoraea]|uniref:Patatin n=1 Tax=Pandoraea communis TaxID=2508297 RepID=A0A5E4S3M4_9BURK|nr:MULTISPECIES: patatin-like phospholipase family protein [Pandoraea]EON14393.1 patatin [Pandoraea sp. SD6-2]VVD70200.1 Patatin [Pandoraea communis]
MISGERTGLVLMGGGARAAYQVGVLAAIAAIQREVLPSRRAIPFPIVCGTSAGAINAASLASHADDFQHSVMKLDAVWRQFHAGQVFRADSLGIAGTGARWLAALSLGWALRRSPRSLFDWSPLADMLRNAIRLDRLPEVFASGALQALSVTALSYSSGQHVTFYQSAEPIQAWKRSLRLARAVPLTVEHLLASSAIPFLFPAIELDLDGQAEYFGDGSMRQIAPLSPPIHLGATRILIIGAAHGQYGLDSSGERIGGYPSLAQIGGQALASVFIDGLSADLERLQHINNVLRHVPEAQRESSGWRPIETLVISPSQRIEPIAARHLQQLPRAVRTILGAIGADEARGAAFASYLLFESSYTQELIALGEADAYAQRDAIAAWLVAEADGTSPFDNVEAGAVGSVELPANSPLSVEPSDAAVADTGKPAA